MARRKTLSDETLLDLALELIHRDGPDSITFASLSAASGLSGATLVQRFSTKRSLVRAALLHAWDALDRKTEELAAALPETPEGAVKLLCGLSSDYGDGESYANGLLVLREDLRDPDLRARGVAWGNRLSEAVGRRLGKEDAPASEIGRLMITHWQGSLIWWGFEQVDPLPDYVEQSLRRFLDTLGVPGGA